MKVIFWADSGSTVGMGHLMRSLSLAAEFHNAGFLVIFISYDPVGVSVIKEKGLTVYELDGTKSKTSIEGIIRFLKMEKADIVIMDSYQIDEDFFLKVKPHAKLLCYIDDLNRFSYQVDVLINGNIRAELMGYQSYTVQELLLLGTKFNLIRAEFRNPPLRKTRQKISRLLITTGGSDPFNLTEKIVRSVKNEPKLRAIQLDVVIGKSFVYRAELLKLKEIFSKVNFHENVTRMSDLMLNADLTISAGGSTLYELCACGVPALVIVMADNQKFIVEQMEKQGYIYNLGWYEQTDFGKLPELINNFSYQTRVEISSKMQTLVDGYGVVRVRDSIIQYYDLIYSS